MAFGRLAIEAHQFDKRDAGAARHLPSQAVVLETGDYDAGRAPGQHALDEVPLALVVELGNPGNTLQAGIDEHRVDT